MALFKPLLGDESRISLEVTPFHEGYVYFVKEGFLYFDVNLGTEEEPNNQRIKLKADAEIAQKLIELNNLSEMAFWIGTKEEYEAIETKEDNVLYIVTDDFQDVSFEDKSNKVTEITPTSTDDTYASAKAIYNAILAYGGTDIETTNVIGSTSTEDKVPNAKAVYNAINNNFNLAEKTANKVSTLSESSTDTTYPSAKAVVDYIVNSTPTIYSSTSEPTSEDGKVGDIWVVI